MKTVIVTGGCGFIGSHFIRILMQRGGYRIVNVDKLTYAGDVSRLRDLHDGEQYRLVAGDIVDQELVDRVFQQEKPWGLINFAAESHVDRSILDSSPFLRTNILGVQTLLEAARKYGLARFVQISTDEVYGDAAGKAPFNEESPLIPSSPYAATKASADLLCLAYARTYSISVTIVRSSNNYGPYQFPEKLIPLMIRNALRSEELPVYGDGTQRRDWLYVDDNVEGIARILEKGREGDIYNLGTGVEMANLEVVCMLCQRLAQETGRAPDVFTNLIRSVGDRPGHDQRYSMDAKKVREELEWKPSMPLEERLRATVHWYVANQDWADRIASGEYKQYYEAVYKRRWGACGG